MQERYKEALLSPQFKDQDYDLSTQECRKFSSIWAAEFNTPETKYRSTIGANRIDISKDANLLHFRNRTAKFEDEQNQLYIEIQNLYDKRQFDIPNLVETKILYKTETVPNRFMQIYSNRYLIIASRENKMNLNKNRNLMIKF